MLAGRSGRFLVAGIPVFWLAVFFLVPFLFVLKISFSSSAIAQPPYVPAFDLLGESLGHSLERARDFTADNYRRLAQDSIYVESFLSSLRIAAVSTILTLLVGYPLALGMARAPRSLRPALLMFVMLPFFTSFLIRIYAWMAILSPEGLLSHALLALHLIDAPLALLSTSRAVYIGIVYCYLPFMVLPLYASLERLDDSLIEAAQDLGATPFHAFWRVTFPLSLPGVIAGCLLVFIPAVGEFVIPDLLGGSDTQMIGKTMWEEFFENRDWPAASAVAIALLVAVVLPMVLVQNRRARASETP